MTILSGVVNCVYNSRARYTAAVCTVRTVQRLAGQCGDTMESIILMNIRKCLESGG